MKKYFFYIFFISSATLCAQEPDSIKIKVDSITTKINKLEVAKDSIIAADTMRYWKKGGIGGINFAQSSFTNWAAGGENALSATALLSVYANYKKDKTTWDNTLDLAYGMIQSGKAPLRKNEDKIDFSSKYGRHIKESKWYYSALVNFKSQFDAGYNFPNDSTVISRFLSPGYVLGAIGFDYKPKDYLSFFISPVTSKTTIVADAKLADAGAYGVAKAEYDTAGVKIKDGQMVRSEFGGYLRFTFKKDIFKNVNFATKLELFSNYLNNPQNIDVNWENIVGLKINKYLSASISTNMIYDHDIPVTVTEDVNGLPVTRTGPRLQFKQVLAVGFSYKF